MLIKILIVIGILGVISYFKEKVFFKWLWLVLIFGVCCLTEALFIFVWYCNDNIAKDIPIYEKENEKIEQQITEIKKELLRGNLTEEKLESILETYSELESKRQDIDRIIEDSKSWLESERENIEAVIFLK